ncbi:hypothetical protein GCM10025859_48410 [Alicyclobacillus fastidiosus]|nr:hypothetical protein GCM10025859_48410 [Alicyclobacillus fastidiosus]
MKLTFRWYGDEDPVKLEYIRQIPGMKGIVSAIYDIPVGETWPLEAIWSLKEKIHKAGLELSVIESVPVHEDIKLGLPTRDQYISNYQQTLRNLAEAGVQTVCYNFMPVFDWTRSALNFRLEDQSTTLIYDHDVVQAMNPLKGSSNCRGGIRAMRTRLYRSLSISTDKYLKNTFGSTSITSFKRLSQSQKTSE